MQKLYEDLKDADGTHFQKIFTRIMKKKYGENFQSTKVYGNEGDKKVDGILNFNIGFTPREATEKEYNILFEEIQRAEKLLINDYVINNAGNFENIKQMIFKHKEEIAQIVHQNKKGE